MATAADEKNDDDEEEEEATAAAAAAEADDEPAGSVAMLSMPPSTELAASPQLVLGLPGPRARWLYWLCGAWLWLP